MFEGDSADMFGRKFPPFSLNVEGYSQHPSFLYELDTMPINTTDINLCLFSEHKSLNTVPKNKTLENTQILKPLNKENMNFTIF